MAMLVRSLCRSVPALRQTSCLVARRTVTNTGLRNAISKGENLAYEEMQQYWARNKALKRPLAPTLTTHKYHLTMLISIGNRVTSVALQAGITLGAIALMIAPGQYAEYLTKLKAMTGGAALIFLTKLALAAVFSFHIVAGLRHFVWDVGMGYSKKLTLQGSYAVVIATVVLTAILMMIKPKMPEVKK